MTSYKWLSIFGVILVFNSSKGFGDDTKHGSVLCSLGNCGLKDLTLGAEKQKPPAPVAEPRKGNRKKGSPKKASIPNPITAASPFEVAGNLPVYYRSLDRSDFKSSEGNIYNAPHPMGAKLPGLRSGDLI